MHKGQSVHVPAGKDRYERGDEMKSPWQCFAGGAESGPHKRSHNYRVRTSGGVSIFSGAPSVQAVRGRSTSRDTNLDDESACISR